MGWYKTKRTILNKPYLIDPYRQISLSEAKEHWRKVGYPSDEELLNRACLIAGKTSTEWSFLFNREKDREQTFFAKLKNVKLFGKPAIIISAIVLALIALLTFTVPGRTFAKNIFDTITKIIEDILYIRPDDTFFPDGSLILPQDIPDPQNKENGTSEFKNLKEAQEYIGKSIIFLDSLEYTVTDIIVNKSLISGTSLEHSYSNSSGIGIDITQRWTEDISVRALSIDISDADYQKKELPMGLVIEGILTEDNTYTGLAIIGDTSFIISINGETLNWDTINAVLNNLNYYSIAK